MMEFNFLLFNFKLITAMSLKYHKMKLKSISVINVYQITLVCLFAC